MDHGRHDQGELVEQARSKERLAEPDAALDADVTRRLLRSVTYATGSAVTAVVLDHSSAGALDVNTCFRVRLTKPANGSTSDVGQ